MKRGSADLSEKAPQHLEARAEQPIKNPKECRSKRTHHENHTCRQQNFAARWPRHLRNFRADLLNKLEWVRRSHLRTLCELHCPPNALS